MSDLGSSYWGRSEFFQQSIVDVVFTPMQYWTDEDRDFIISGLVSISDSHTERNIVLVISFIMASLNYFIICHII